MVVGVLSSPTGHGVSVRCVPVPGDGALDPVGLYGVEETVSHGHALSSAG